MGAVSPAEFIPLVEKTALIGALSNWVIHTALAQAGRWHANGHPMKIAINLSARNFEEWDICQRLEAACAQYSVDPRFVEIECTEGVWMESAAILATLKKIQESGMAISLDDFGTGYSNFSYLQKLPATIVKLDQSLLRNLDSDDRDRHIVRSLITLARSLDYRIVAEGVETPAALKIVTDWGADEAQGYLIDMPLSAIDFDRRLLAQSQLTA